jgi:hypothetical protein
MSEIASLRRYYFAKAKAAAVREEEALALAWRTRQRETAATALPSGFPHRVALVAAWYEAVEDLRGADVTELRTFAGLNRYQAEAVLAALALIP